MPVAPPKIGLPRIGFVSLGCHKALVDSERIITKLRAEGYELSPSYEGADAVVVNTCGFLNSAKEESLEAIGEALAENGKVIVTGCQASRPAASANATPTSSPSPARINMRLWSRRCTRRCPGRTIPSSISCLRKASD
jgi:hypothetical protein